MELMPAAGKSPTSAGMKRFRLIAGVVLLIMLNYILFAPEINATFWHLFHGSHVEMRGIRFEIPWLYRVDPTANRDTFNAWSHQGVVRQHYSPTPLLFSSIDVDMRPLMISHTPPDPQQEAYYLKKIGMEPAGEFTASVAGRQGVCKKTRSIDLTSPMGDHPLRISCLLGSDLRITFSGSERKAWQLDNFLRDAKAVSQNH